MTSIKSEVLTPVEKLMAIEEIKQLKARYFRGVDTRDWELFESTFKEDVVVDFRGAITDSNSSEVGLESMDNENVVRGAQNWTQLVASTQRENKLISKHHGHMPEIEITSPTTAKAIWAMDDLVLYPESPEIEKFFGWGHYHETYEKINGKWLISTILLTRVHLYLTKRQT